MKRKSTRQAKREAKSKLAGAIPSKSPQNKKILFGDEDDVNSVDDGLVQVKNDDNDEEGDVDDKANEDIKGEDDNAESDSDDNDDAVEEVKGSAARESTQRLREAERKVAKELITKKKRKKKEEIENKDEGSESEEDENEEDDDPFTEDFFKAVDSERAVQVQKAKQEKKSKKLQQKKKLGKHTTFVVEDEHKMTDAPHMMDQNIEVVAIGGETATDESASNADEERLLLISATLGSAPSKAAMAFARGGMSCGTAKERSSDSRKRKSKNEETWKRSRKHNKLGVGSRSGQAAVLFVSRR